MKTPNWKNELPIKPISKNQVDICRGPLSLSEKERDLFLEILSPEEKEKAFRFHFEKDRTAYIASRGMLRLFLSHYMEEKPESIQFEYNDFGKPFLKNGIYDKKLHFNLAHAGNLVLFAFTSDQEIGIDVEFIREDFSIDTIVNNYFCSQEIQEIQKLDPSAAFTLFFKFWARKEAILKAMGKGLSFPLEKCNVSLVRGLDFSRVILTDAQEVDKVWYVMDLLYEDKYTAALALKKPEVELSFWDFPMGM
ncbi:4'-phosphopantetheinyl transferase family protein [Cecembia rubra]|uniref:4'-phosphopantetheinyl transferase family protein n=1 Tax=Cecembia rubra TaxID=1485585 RepID=UPI0027149758|nr:4'-phosphopantetheinyl transferase superfamily protein [Cecembia rubra]